jgi:hypothetical protein
MDDYDGKIVFKNGVQYNGAIENGNIHGKGKITFVNGIVYQGEFRNNRIEGKGRLEYSSSEVYEGNFVNFEKTGFGKYINSEQGVIYEGEWSSDQFHGKGELTKQGQWVYKGEFKYNQKEGTGRIEYLNSKSLYEGEFKNGQKSGKGVMTWTQENNHYDGEWQNNMVHGFGIYTYKDQLDPIRFVHNIYIGPFHNNNKSGFGFHIFSDGSMLSGKWTNGIKEGTFIYRDRFGHFFLKSFEQNHLKTTKSIKTDSGCSYISDESLPKVQLVRTGDSEEVWINILKSYVGLLKDLFKESVEEIIKSREKERDIYCLNLQEVIQIFKNYRLFDEQTSIYFIENFIRSNSENAISLSFSKDNFESYVQQLQSYLDGKIFKYNLPFEFKTTKNESLFLNSFQFINLFFVMLQVRFGEAPQFEQTLRRFMDNWINPVKSKELKPPSLFPDYKSVLIIYNTHLKKSKENFKDLYKLLDSTRMGQLTHREFLNFLVRAELISMEKISQVSIFFRVCERFNDPYTSLYSKLKTEKSLSFLSESKSFQKFLNNFISLEDFTNNLVLYLHKKLYKAGNHFPKNDVIGILTNLLDAKTQKGKIKIFPKRKILASLENKHQKTRSIESNGSQRMSPSDEILELQKAADQLAQENIRRELELMTAEDYNVLLIDNDIKQFSTAKNSTNEFKDSVPELVGNYNQAPYIFFV